uniref:Uncharacterized protein n=1 Tax=Arundo donax TaxID=35708 RepID=A0A0A9F138_ARUDO
MHNFILAVIMMLLPNEIPRSWMRLYLLVFELILFESIAGKWMAHLFPYHFPPCHMIIKNASRCEIGKIHHMHLGPLWFETWVNCSCPRCYDFGCLGAALLPGPSCLL